MQVEQKRAMIKVWSGMLDKYDYNEMTYALELYTKGGERFAPNLSQLIKIADDNRNFFKPSADDMWRKLKDAVRNSGYPWEAAKEYEKLPDEIKHYLGNASELMRLARSDEDGFEKYERKRFCQYIEQNGKRSEIRCAIEEGKINMIEEG